MSDVDSLQELFESEIRRIDQILMEREKEANRALAASERAIAKAEAEGLRARESQNEWRGAMNDRESAFATNEVVGELRRQLIEVRKSQDVATGRRVAWVAAAGIIMTLLAIGVGQIIRQGITSVDVSSQIQREAPWNRDKQQVERRITLLERDVQGLEVKVNKLESDLRAHQTLDHH